ncbi:ALS2 C-terminal-like protein [Dromiciops gliroides]|uniref:ALS2 C-terminal-like protein n=1 Tax=Dromiciops gliroides TaxID=33562 RepID=UPI001CC7AB75|nr:ALS2 C-terminal-like protein [Dromiciops gliroides]XP_043831306.1 ALS2 C-terminal-like protein [Dromiciops gliroides]
MCTPEETSLLQVEETFLALLGRINTLVFQPLLLVEEPSHSKDQECLRLLLQLSEQYQCLWELTQTSLRTLRQRLNSPATFTLHSLHLLDSLHLFLEAYQQYFVIYTSCVAVQTFQKATRKKSEFWRSQRKALKQFLTNVILETSGAEALPHVLCQPLTDHVQQYVLLLLRLGDAVGQRHPAWVQVIQAADRFVALQSFIRQALKEASATQALWEMLSNKLVDALCTADRRLLQDSQEVPVVASPVRADRILLFNDALVLLQGHSFQIFDLKLVWVDGKKLDKKQTSSRYGFCVITPEEEFFLSAKDVQGKACWLSKVSQAICQALSGKRDMPTTEQDQEQEGVKPPASRCCLYTFRTEERLRLATYDGDWFWGKPHGKGTLKWPDGRNHVGGFHQGLEHGFGIRLVPNGTEDKYDCYKCHWREGQMLGYGICEYANESMYKGYFRDNMRHGFGVLESSPQAPKPFKFMGHWDRDKKNGYGVLEDKDRGERYIGMWQADHRHGQGIVVTQSGICYQRTFHADKMVGPGILLLEDDSLYEGSFTRDLVYTGKGKITFPNGYFLKASFSTGIGKGFHTQGVLETTAHTLDPLHTCKRQLGLDVFPVESRWRGIYQQFQEFIHSNCPEDAQEAFLGFHIQTAKELRKSQEYLFCDRSNPDEVSAKIKDILAELPTHREPESLQLYLQKALKSSVHPLGKLLKMLTLAFQATYSGMGANKHLLVLAQEEVRHHAKEIWAFYQGLLRVALKQQGQIQEESEDTDKSHPEAYRLVLPLILPCFYPELFMLYMLYHEREDSLYSQGISDLSLFPDTKLLECLDVQKHLWPLKDLTLTTNQRHSLVRDKCFLSATECLQKIITTVDPREKLEMIEKTYNEIEDTVSRVLEREYKLPMDDLLPLLIYVVSRARIQHLGAEIHLIRDMMDPIHRGGLYDFLLTALESCYEHIQKEDMRLHHLAGVGNQKALW